MSAPEKANPSMRSITIELTDAEIRDLTTVVMRKARVVETGMLRSNIVLEIAGRVVVAANSADGEPMRKEVKP